ncbi:hypothetical protein D3C79_759090 [compost metagenome]
MLQAATTVDVVIAQADIQGTEGPVLASALGNSLEHRRLATQAPFQVKISIQAHFAIFYLTLAAQRAR